MCSFDFSASSFAREDTREEAGEAELMRRATNVLAEGERLPRGERTTLFSTGMAGAAGGICSSPEIGVLTASSDVVVGGVEDKERLNELWDVPEDAILNLDAGRDYTADNLYFRFSGYILSYILAARNVVK